MQSSSLFISSFLILVLINYQFVYCEDTKPVSPQFQQSKEAARGYNNRGLLYMEKNLYDLAIEDYNKAVEYHPRYAEAYNNRGYAFIKKGEYQNALNDVISAIKIDKGYADAYANRCFTYINMGELVKAELDCNKSISLDKQLYKAYLFRGIIHKAKCDKKNAKDDFNAVIKDSPDKLLVIQAEALLK
ncbi:MAG: tetratricopeptide repeat protein [Deltaproteobacteria bacterium]|nr:MAG: tetratricopeptide repeat protein [Deltaproteobacteria bacterium]